MQLLLGLVERGHDLSNTLCADESHFGQSECSLNCNIETLFDLRSQVRRSRVGNFFRVCVKFKQSFHDLDFITQLRIGDCKDESRHLHEKSHFGARAAADANLVRTNAEVRCRLLLQKSRYFRLAVTCDRKEKRDRIFRRRQRREGCSG